MSSLEIEPRVASYERGQKAQKYFPVSICVTGWTDEAQQGYCGWILRPRGGCFVKIIRRTLCDFCHSLISRRVQNWGEVGQYRKSEERERKLVRVLVGKCRKCGLCFVCFLDF